MNNNVEPQEIIKVMNMLLEQGLITSEEYRKAKTQLYTD